MASNKINFQGIKRVYLPLIFYALMLSCYGQVQTKSDTLSHHSSNSLHILPFNYEDPLFFIGGQLCQHLRKIYQDSKGNLWFGTNVYDIMKYDGNTLNFYTDVDGLSSGRITDIVEDDEANIWFGTSAGLTKFDGKSFSTYTEKEGLLNKEIWSLMIDTKGIFWIGHNAGVSRFDGEKFTSFSIPQAKVKEVNTIYSPDRVVSIVEDKEGNIWFGTDGFGICKYDPSAEHKPDGKTFTNFTKEEGLCDNTIHELMADSKGNLWIGTFFGGVCKYDGEKFKNYTKKGIISGVEVGGFFEDFNGDIWFAAENNGVYCYDGLSFTHLGSEQGLLTNGILSIYRDEENRFWFGGWGGLFRYDGKFFQSVSIDGPWLK